MCATQTCCATLRTSLPTTARSTATIGRVIRRFDRARRRRGACCASRDVDVRATVRKVGESRITESKGEPCAHAVCDERLTDAAARETWCACVTNQPTNGRTATERQNGDSRTQRCAARRPVAFPVVAGLAQACSRRRQAACGARLFSLHVELPLRSSSLPLSLSRGLWLLA
jgi:hypothetical protein